MKRNSKLYSNLDLSIRHPRYSNLDQWIRAANNLSVLRHVSRICVLSVVFGCAAAPTARVVRAQIEIDAATLAGADKYAIYEITKAREYLHKAREQIGYSEFQVAQKYADLAVENGEKAKQQAREHPTEEALPQGPAQPRRCRHRRLHRRRL